MPEQEFLKVLEKASEKEWYWLTQFSTLKTFLEEKMTAPSTMRQGFLSNRDKFYVRLLRTLEKKEK